MSADYTIVFELLKKEESTESFVLQTPEEVKDSVDISELARLSETLREPEPLIFMVG